MKSKISCERLWTCQHAFRSKRRASVIVCVMLVLFVSGMMAMQGTRMLMAAKRSQQQSARTEQAQELLALGRLRLLQQLRELGEKFEGESFTTELLEGFPSEPIVAEIRIEKISGSKAPVVWRIVTNHPLNQPGQVTASWESE